MHSSSPEESDQEGEARNREAVRTLLKLRNESLMAATAKGSKVTGVKLDYGNASAWMREIPGRFGKIKQTALLEYLGIEGQRLSPSKIHNWILPRQGDKELNADFSKLLDTYAAQPSRYAWMIGQHGGLKGLAIFSDGASIVFQPTNTVNRTEMEHWLAQSKLTKAQDASAEVGEKSEELWEKLISNQILPEALWSSVASEPTQDWQPVIAFANQSGMSPNEVLEILKSSKDGSGWY